MEIRDGLAGLNSLLGASATGASSDRGKSQSASGPGAFGTDHATLSIAASEMAQGASEPGVRMERVSAIQSALAEGRYSVPASAVASKIVDSMLGSK
jgi:negative regulator of flagellin synthesis FlgM